MPLYATEHPYQYFRSGSPNDVQTKTQAGFALMGGGDDLDEAFKWMCASGQAGATLLCCALPGTKITTRTSRASAKLDSVATLILKSRGAAKDPFVADAIRHAEAVFIAGGDQAHYINWWMDTPVQQALNEDDRARRSASAERVRAGGAGRVCLFIRRRATRRMTRI